MKMGLSDAAKNMAIDRGAAFADADRREAVRVLEGEYEQALRAIRAFRSFAETAKEFRSTPELRQVIARARARANILRRRLNSALSLLAELQEGDD